MCVCMHAYVYVCMCVYVCMYMCVCMHVYVCVCMYTCICMYVCMYVCMYADQDIVYNYEAALSLGFPDRDGNDISLDLSNNDLDIQV